MSHRVETLAEGVTLYLGDSFDIFHITQKPDLVFADPPYGVNGAQNSKTKRGYKKNGYDLFEDSVEYVRERVIPIIETCVMSCRVVVTPGNRCLTLYPPPDSFGAIYQPASVGLQPWGRADAQPILYYGKSPHGGKALPSHRCSFILTERSMENGHPCPKPIGFMKSMLNSASVYGELVLDPFMGSGTTGVAAVKLGRKFTGIEIDERYFDIACRRISEALKQSDLFIEPPNPAKQEALL